MTMCSISKIHSTPARAGMPEIVEMPATVLASAGTPTAPYGRRQLMRFHGNSRKSRQNGEQFVKKDVKK